MQDGKPCRGRVKTENAWKGGGGVLVGWCIYWPVKASLLQGGGGRVLEALRPHHPFPPLCFCLLGCRFRASSSVRPIRSRWWWLRCHHLWPAGRAPTLLSEPRGIPCLARVLGTNVCVGSQSSRSVIKVRSLCATGTTVVPHYIAVHLSRSRYFIYCILLGEADLHPVWGVSVRLFVPSSSNLHPHANRDLTLVWKKCVQCFPVFSLFIFSWKGYSFHPPLGFWGVPACSAAPAWHRGTCWRWLRWAWQRCASSWRWSGPWKRGAMRLRAAGQPAHVAD